MSISPRALLARAASAVERFFLAPARHTPLAALRMGLATVLLVQAAMIAPAFHDLYDRAGIVQGALSDALAPRGLPHLGWLIGLLRPLGVADSTVVLGCATLYVLALLALLVGWKTRVAAFTAWLTHLTLMTSSSTTDYGADLFANVFLFHLTWMPSGAVLSLDRLKRRHRGLAGPDPSWLARLSLRVVQIQLCIAYLNSGLEKAKGPPWWNGAAMWQSLMLPDYQQIDFSWLAQHSFIAVAAGWMVLFIEIGYPVLIWPKLTRKLMVIAVVALHLGIIFFMGLYIFGVIMIMLTLAAFAVPAEPLDFPVKLR